MARRDPDPAHEKKTWFLKTIYPKYANAIN